jgi:hypothetical protein
MRTSQSPRFVALPFSLLRVLAIFAVGALAAAAASAQETITLPAAASIQGISPFFSDVRIFNTSYTSASNITATYRCFLGPCPGAAPQITINLASRDSQAFNDIVADAFGSPNTAGGIEFTSDTPPGTLIVTSRLYSTSPNPTVGMFIPGLNASQAHTLSALTSVESGTMDSNQNNGAGFRTNVGVFNPNDSPATITFTGFANHAPVGGNVQRVVPPHSGVQVNAFFDALGAGDENTDNGVVLVSSDVPVFSYAAVIDNNTSDPYLVIGSPDQAQFGSLTATPTGGVTGTPTQTRTPVHQRTATPTPNASASPTPTPPASSSPLVRRFADSTTGRRPAPGPSAAQADNPRVALLFEERYLAVLRGPRQGGGGW